MESLLWILPVTAVSGCCLYVFVQILTGSGRFAWAESPLVGSMIGLTGVVANLFCIKQILDGTEWGVFILLLSILLSAAGVVPPGMLIFISCVGRMSDAIVTPGARRIRNRQTCDKAERAVRARRYDEAEALFQEALRDAERDAVGAPNSRDRGSRAAQWIDSLSRRFTRDAVKGPEAPIRLSYGNFLASRGRRTEAASQWAAASEGDLPSEQALMAALRAAEAYAESDGGTVLAQSVLDRVLKRFPEAPEAPMVAARRAALTGNHPARPL